MRPSVRTVSAALLVALTPEAARAFAWTALAGVDYQRLDTESAAGTTASFPRLDVNLRLDATGATPRIVTWSGGVGYRRLAVSQDGFDDVRDQLTYQLRTTWLTDPRSAVAFDVHASRGDETSSLEGISSTQVHTTTYGADLRLNPVDRPYLLASYAFTGTEQETPLLGSTERTVQTFSATTGHGSSSYTYRGSYRLNRSEGTFALDGYDDHRVDVMADARVADEAKISLMDTYYLRTPREGADLAPRLETNAFVANLRTYEARSNVQSLTYGYTRGVRSTPAAGAPPPPGGGELERTQHRLAYALERQLPHPEWRVRGQVRLSYADDRVDGEASRTGGESLSFTTYWRRERAKGDRTEVHAGPTVALLQSGAGETTLGYGAAAGAAMNRAIGAIQASGSYDVSYGTDVDAEAGWTFSQSAIGTVSGRLGLGTLRSSLLLSALRRESPPPVGGAASRAVTLLSGYGRGSTDVSLQASLQDGAVAGVEGLGLFLTPGYDTRHRSLSLAAATSPWSFLNLRARVRYVLTDLPDRPSTDEKEAYAGIEYVYGALRFALEDRYVIAGSNGGETRYNQVFVRAYRAFGARY